MKTIRYGLALLVAATSLSACGEEINFSDTIDLEFDLFQRRDNLHQPYVAGADFSFCADTDRDGKLRGKVLRSRNESVLELGGTDSISDTSICADAIARGAGKTVVEVLDDGDVIATAEIDVRAPDRAELYAAGPMLANRDDFDPRTARPKILEEGTATFLVRYFDGETRLHGSGALEASASGTMAAEPLRTLFFEDRDWVQLSALEAGTQTVTLATAAGELQEVEVEVVPEDAIADVAIHGGDETDRERGAPMMAFAQAYGEEDEPIYGVEYEWTIAGDTQAEHGDLFYYDYDPDRREDLVAKHGDLEAVAEIRAGEGNVDSSNDVGCSVGGRSGGGWALMLLALVGLVRRRNR